MIAEEARAVEEARAAAKAAEKARAVAEARRLAYYQARWASDVNLGAEDVARVITTADGIVPQVDAENGHIESRLRALTNLLSMAWGKIPPATARVELSSADASVVAAYVGSALDSMQLPETNGDPVMKLPLEGSPSARSMTVCEHRSTSRHSAL